MSSFVGSFEINGVNMTLPGAVSKEVAEAIGVMMLDVARNGVGERRLASGMLIIAGEESRLMELGELPKRNKFKAEEISVLSMEATATSDKIASQLSVWKDDVARLTHLVDTHINRCRRLQDHEEHMSHQSKDSPGDISQAKGSYSRIEEAGKGQQQHQAGPRQGQEKGRETRGIPSDNVLGKQDEGLPRRVHI